MDQNLFITNNDDFIFIKCVTEKLIIRFVPDFLSKENSNYSLLNSLRDEKIKFIPHYHKEFNDLEKLKYLPLSVLEKGEFIKFLLSNWKEHSNHIIYFQTRVYGDSFIKK